jgi:hypothetical protein
MFELATVRHAVKTVGKDESDYNEHVGDARLRFHSSMGEVPG